MRISRKITLVIAIFILLLFGMAAAVAEESATYDVNRNAIIIYSDNCSANGSYMLFLLKSDASTTSFTQADIQFMDQVNASVDGRLSVVYAAPEFDACQVFLSGVFANGAASPRCIGTVQSKASVLRAPAALTEIEESAFEGGMFTHVFLGTRVTNIGAKAFADCPNLVYIEILAPDVVIDSTAFQGSPNVVIGCRSDSAAESFANMHDIPVQSVD